MNALAEQYYGTTVQALTEDAVPSATVNGQLLVRCIWSRRDAVKIALDDVLGLHNNCNATCVVLRPQTLRPQTV